MTQIIVTILCSVLASSGLWAFITNKVSRNNAEKELLLGLAHDRIMFLGASYIDRMEEVEKLPIHSENFSKGDEKHAA